MTKKALITWGGWQGHEPDKCAEIAKNLLLDENFEIEVSTNLDCYLDEELMNSRDLIVQCWTMGEITKEQCNALVKTVKAGCGIAGWHGGLGDAFRQNTEYQWMIGGQWVAHPGNIIDYTVNITKPEDPIVAGLNDFKINSEKYYMHVDPGNEVLMTTTFTGKHAAWINGTVMPVTWKRRYGKGKVFYTSLGHVAKDLEVPEVKEVLRRGMLWAAK